MGKKKKKKKKKKKLVRKIKVSFWGILISFDVLICARAPN